jgi:hypothetical protein
LPAGDLNLPLSDLPSNIRWYKHQGAVAVEGTRRRIYWGDTALEGHASSRDYVSALKIKDRATALGRLHHLGETGAILNADICTVDDGVLMLKFGNHCLAGYLDDDGDVVLLTGFPHPRRGLRVPGSRLASLRAACTAHRDLTEDPSDDR